MPRGQNEYESVWNGRDLLTESLERDYAAMRGEGWDLIWEPTSPLTTPWEQCEVWARPDPDQFVATSLNRGKRGPRRQSVRILKEWALEYSGYPSQGGSHR